MGGLSSSEPFLGDGALAMASFMMCLRRSFHRWLLRECLEGVALTGCSIRSAVKRLM